MATVAELIDQGVKAYLAGRVKDALAAFQAVLVLDPGNAKARGYIVRIHAVTPASTPTPGTFRAVTPVPGSRYVTPHPVPASPRTERGQEFAPSPWDDGPAAAATYVLEPGGGLDLEAVSEKSGLRPLVPEGAPGAPGGADRRGEPTAWLAAAKELFALGDFSGSLELIEKVLQVDPDHPEARAYLAENEATLVAMYESKLGPRTGVPRLAIRPEEVLWLNLDHRAGFLLAQVDGTVDFEALFALSGLPRLDTARILARLLAEGVIAV
ncbi:tetratricopeptide repeat protein [Anaeromyxobacter sp. SG17]|uniref:tetratricopeptide repeat protein n=1 Tax=Anaeromyxobacter sp. SG17 TaxID=2925405 RepID=UPI001F5937C3|nr:tetratricopeptide repeat protein [Anaeromyxobacter sp. SG17]